MGADDTMETRAQLLDAKVGIPESRADGRARRIKDLGLFFVSVFILMVLVGFSLLTLRDACTPDENRQWALSTLTAVFGGILGWLIKR
ncbi:hypothetical protein CDN99_19745 [Roseateles aquatilis]|uniref:Uncharacterized protein n=1 Tax=Roseateles aquatilis TaxID=431061 RepID=A0A246J2V7_9BURK|nr:hypothetical protein [Roseateles aquatilis]OWQ86937.1 hypothetical protein CDN99_19745 [Roseateles aquatilis]